MTTQPFRIKNGGLVDHSQTINFTFDGVAYQGCRNDTLASALLANGVRLFGRSFKYHRPRGLFSANSHEPCALVEVDEGDRCEPNIPATMVDLHEGLVARSQNCWPSLRHDFMSVTSLLSPFFVAGFYYKTFKWPAKFWTNIYEPIIRKAAGLGSLSGLKDPDNYEKSNAHCDILVVGAGSTGVTAALSAAKSGARVIICDETTHLGGLLLSESPENFLAERDILRKEISTLIAMPNVKIMPRSTVFGWYDNNTFGVIERCMDHMPANNTNQPRQKMWKIVAKEVVLATGAHERPITFPNNDRPGIMLASAVKTYINQFGVMPGKKAVIFTNNDSTLSLAKDMQRVGIEIAAYVDVRKSPNLPDSIHFTDHVIENTTGKYGITSVDIRPRDGGAPIKVDCDLLCVSGGWNPAVQLQAQRGLNPVWSKDHHAFMPRVVDGDGFICAGSILGEYLPISCLQDGQHAGTIAAEKALNKREPDSQSNDNIVEEASPPAPMEPFFVVESDKGKSFIDLQHDVTKSDVELAAREGYQSVEHVKRYTTLGMATDQGKTSNVNGIAVLSASTGKPMDAVGTTGFRPPYTPVSIGALAGRSRGKHWRPTLQTPLHNWVLSQGGKFVESGMGLRSQYFPKPNESMQQAINREVLAVRNSVGFCDVSTLGKIDLQGPDALEFINRVYTNGFSKLAVGKSRYGLMLREDGIVFDDGTVTRLGENHYFLTTTSAEADSIISHLEYCHQVLWPDLDICMANCQEQWAAVSLAGPKSREVLGKIVDHLDVSNDALPFLSAVEAKILGGITARIFRISFSGELAYEIFVPANQATKLASTLMIAGAPNDITPYGVEALDVLRIEKGHVSSELNAFTTADDLALGGMLSKQKRYIGDVLRNRDGLTATDREAVVGLKPLNPNLGFNQGAHMVPKGGKLVPENDLGYITSAAWSPTLNSHIAIALIKGGSSRIGETVDVVDPLNGRKPVSVEVVSHHFYDAENSLVKS